MVIGASQDRSATCRRIEVRTPIQVAAAEGGTLGLPVPSTLRDISRTGATLLHSSVIPVGACLALFLGGEDEPLRILGVAIYSKRFADGTALVTLAYTGFIDPRSRQLFTPCNDDGFLDDNLAASA